MALLVVLLSAIAAVNGRLQCNTNGPIPSQSPPVDMGKFKGTWYETVTTFDPTSLNHACRVNQDFTDTMNPVGFQALLTIYFDNAPTRTSTIHISSTKDGHFIPRIIERNETIGHEEDENGNLDPGAVSEIKELEWEEYGILGDPNHYFALVKCTSRGWLVWAFTKEKAITPELLVYVHNDLLKHGVFATFRLSRCKDVIEK